MSADTDDSPTERTNLGAGRPIGWSDFTSFYLHERRGLERALIVALGDSELGRDVGRFVLDWPEADVAAALRIRPGTAKSRTSRGLARIAETSAPIRTSDTSPTSDSPLFGCRPAGSRRGTLVVMGEPGSSDEELRECFVEAKVPLGRAGDPNELVVTGVRAGPRRVAGHRPGRGETNRWVEGLK